MVTKISKAQLVAKTQSRYGDTVKIEYRRRGKETGWYLSKANYDSCIGQNVNEAWDWLNQLHYLDLSHTYSGVTYDFITGALQDELLYIDANGYMALTLLEHSDLTEKRTAVHPVDRFAFEVGMEVIVPPNLCEQGFLPLGIDTTVLELTPTHVVTEHGTFDYDQPLIFSDETDNYHQLFDLAFTHLLNTVAKIQQTSVIPFPIFRGKKGQEIVRQSGIKSDTDELGDEQVANIDKDWITAEQFSTLVGITERMAQKIFSNVINGKKWRNHELQARTIQKEVGGGRGGVSYELYAPTLPIDLKAKWYAQFVDIHSVVTCHIPTHQTLTSGSFINNAQHKYNEAQWRYNVIKRALIYPFRSADRAKVINEIAAQEQIRPDGSRVKLTIFTIYNWLNKYGNLNLKQGGLTALVRKQRADLGNERVRISRLWDQAFEHLGDKDRIYDELNYYIRSLWASGCPTWRMVLRFAESKLIELTRPYAGELEEGILTNLCVLSRARIERERQFTLVAINEQDAKLYFDKYLPRIKRDRSGIQPMDVIVGDVHPVDIGVRRNDGSVAYPRIIAWLDVATNRIWLTLVLLEKGEGIKREHVAMSFANMCQNWGLPKKVYLDNGSEYNWSEMIRGFSELTHLAQKDFAAAYLDDSPELSAIIRARPYNAPAKPIEGIFSILEQNYFKLIPGWVGGDRMKKKTHNVGKEPILFPGTWPEFHAAVDAVLALYHTQTQYGGLAGRSPYEVLQEHIKSGWGKTAIGYTELLLAFCEEEPRAVYAGGYVRWDGVWYRHDKLMPYATQKITLRYPKHDPRFVFALLGKKLLCAAPVAERYGFLDRDGAKEQSRMASELRRYIAGLKRDCDRLDLVAVSQELMQHTTPPVMPNQQEITISTELTQMMESLEQATVSLLDQVASQKPVSQWRSATEINPLLANLIIEDDELNAAATAGG